MKLFLTDTDHHFCNSNGRITRGGTIVAFIKYASVCTNSVNSIALSLNNTYVCNGGCAQIMLPDGSIVALFRSFLDKNFLEI